eukprot:scaffold26499_cov69-Phaeocystis_antarctica.AAC.6
MAFCVAISAGAASASASCASAHICSSWPPAAHARIASPKSAALRSPCCSRCLSSACASRHEPDWLHTRSARRHALKSRAPRAASDSRIARPRPPAAFVFRQRCSRRVSSSSRSHRMPSAAAGIVPSSSAAACSCPRSMSSRMRVRAAIGLAPAGTRRGVAGGVMGSGTVSAADA